MTSDKDEQLCNKYPKIFRLRNDKQSREPICEICGSPGKTISAGSWSQTQCVACETPKLKVVSTSNDEKVK